MAFGCSMVDLINWKASFGSTNVDLKSYLGNNPMQIVVYGLDDTVAKARGGHYEKDKSLMFYLELSPIFFREAPKKKDFDRPVMITSKSSTSISGAGFISNEEQVYDSEEKDNTHHRRSEGSRGSYENFDGFLDYALNSSHSYKIQALSSESLSDNDNGFSFDDGLIDESEFDEFENEEEKGEVDNTTDEFEVSSINTDEIYLFDSSSDEQSDDNDWKAENEDYLYLSDSETEDVKGLDTYLNDMDTIQSKQNQFYFYSNPHSSKYLEKMEEKDQKELFSTRPKKFFSRKFGGNYTSLKENIEKKIQNLKKLIYEEERKLKRKIKYPTESLHLHAYDTTEIKRTKKKGNINNINLSIPEEVSTEGHHDFDTEQINELLEDQKHYCNILQSLIETKRNLVRKGEKIIRFYSEMERLQQKKHDFSKNILQCVHINIAHWHSIALIVQFLLLISVTIAMLVFHENTGSLTKPLKGYNTKSKYSSEEYINLNIWHSLPSIAHSTNSTTTNQNDSILILKETLPEIEMKIIEEPEPGTKSISLLKGMKVQYLSSDTTTTNSNDFGKNKERVTMEENQTLKLEL